MEPTECTYEEAGRLCGVSAETIRHRAKRGKLQRGRPTNTGRPTVLLTDLDVAAISAGRPTVQPPGRTGGLPPGQDSVVRALEGEATALREALNRERARVDRAEAAVDQQRAELTALHGRLERTEAEVARSRGELARVEAEAATQRQAAEAAAEQAQERAKETVEALAAARQELDARKAGNPLRRALRALRALGHERKKL